MTTIRALPRLALVAAWLATGCAGVPPAAPSTGSAPSTDAAPAPAPAAQSQPSRPAEAKPAPRAPQSTPPAQGQPAPASPPPDLRIVFASDRIALGSEELKQLEAIADRVKGRLGVAVSVESYSSWHGSREFNMALAHRRANAVKEALVKLGVAPGRVFTTAYGEERKSGAPAEQSRVDVRVMSAGG